MFPNRNNNFTMNPLISEDNYISNISHSCVMCLLRARHSYINKNFKLVQLVSGVFLIVDKMASSQICWERRQLVEEEKGWRQMASSCKRTLPSTSQLTETPSVPRSGWRQIVSINTWYSLPALSAVTSSMILHLCTTWFSSSTSNHLFLFFQFT